MGALYEDVERFFGDIFAWYGRQVARFPWLFVIIPLLVCGLLGLGLFSLSYETEIEVLYTPIGSQAANDQDFILRLFPDLTAENFYPQQQITQPTFAEVIVVAKSDAFDNGHVDVDACLNNITSPSVLREIRTLNDVILNLTIAGDTELEFNTYRDVCALRDGQCVVDGSVFIENLTDVLATKPSTDLTDLLRGKVRQPKGKASVVFVVLQLFNSLFSIITGGQVCKHRGRIDGQSPKYTQHRNTHTHTHTCIYIYIYIYTFIYANRQTD